MVRVTHPFHPLKGREFEFVESKHCWQVVRVFCRDSDGSLRSFPSEWTDHGPPDPFVAVSQGRSVFRVSDLLELSDLLEGLSKSRGKQGGVT